MYPVTEKFVGRVISFSNMDDIKSRYMLEYPESSDPYYGKVSEIGQSAGKGFEVKLAWLAGLVDGEGSITIFRRKEKNRKFNYCPAFVITNTNIEIMNEADKLIHEIGAGTHWFHREHSNGRWKDSYTLSTRNVGSIEKIVKNLLPYLVGKKAQAEIILRFIERRKSLKRSGIGYDAESNEMCERILALNKRGPLSSTTIRETPKGDDMV